MYEFNEVEDYFKRLYTPQKEWLNLDIVELKKIFYGLQHIMGWYSFLEIAEAIEANLKVKNT